jgi:hypothetical protein
MVSSHSFIREPTSRTTKPGSFLNVHLLYVFISIQSSIRIVFCEVDSRNLKCGLYPIFIDTLSCESLATVSIWCSALLEWFGLMTRGAAIVMPSVRLKIAVKFKDRSRKQPAKPASRPRAFSISIHHLLRSPPGWRYLQKKSIWCQ